MSHQLINHSPDLKRLRDEGYDIEIRGGFLLLKNVPYVARDKTVKRGTLISKLVLSGDKTNQPDTHVVYFSGEYPCNADGSEIDQIRHTSQTTQLERDLISNHSFSAKPIGGLYRDYYDKMTTYAAMLAGRARLIDPLATAQVFAPVADLLGESVFQYVDTASSRAEIFRVTQKLELGRVAIIGLGGTGSYILDLVAKTPVKEIHLFDGDRFLQHNAFRSPGAPSIDVLISVGSKVDHFKSIYSAMHRGIFAHNEFVDDRNLDALNSMNFVFMCLDDASAKRSIIEKLLFHNIPFVDVGMGLYMADDSLGGILRITTSAAEGDARSDVRTRIPLGEHQEANEYENNIQIADLNALNGALAVIKWKKLFGFYKDFERERFATYTVDGNLIVNEDQL